MQRDDAHPVQNSLPRPTTRQRIGIPWANFTVLVCLAAPLEGSKRSGSCAWFLVNLWMIHTFTMSFNILTNTSRRGPGMCLCSTCSRTSASSRRRVRPQKRRSQPPRRASADTLPLTNNGIFLLFDHPLRNSYALLSSSTACWALFTTIMVLSLFLLILPAVGYALSIIFSLRLTLLLSMMRSGMYSYGIGWITSTFPLEIGSARTSLICSTVRSCTRSCGMIFTVSFVPSLPCGTRTPTIFSTMRTPICSILNHVHSIVNHLWHWDVHNLFHDAFRDSFLNHLTQDVDLFLNPRNGRIHNLFYNASVHEFQSLEYRDVMIYSWTRSLDTNRFVSACSHFSEGGLHTLTRNPSHDRRRAS